MRLWTLHPSCLDAQGLVAAWREALLAQKVLRGRTKGYRSHPQLERFKAHADPKSCIAAFLRRLAEEARARGYRFDASKIGRVSGKPRIAETRGQLLYEWRRLKRKLRARSPEAYRKARGVAVPRAHPLFRIVPGRVRAWEKRTPAARARS
ncbi:MAG TPA: pyrimidine dimer DNA glycosylase/endonuclease V [Elusimicrobiota bacterium]|nr:pyrimidine dimer DNA glycosylase/endonuclease V [Elusimicrobiota bacterium]